MHTRRSSIGAGAVVAKALLMLATLAGVASLVGGWGWSPAGSAQLRPVEVLTGPAAAGRSDDGCSSPFGATAFDFEAACLAHDAGYDQLRDAAASGRVAVVPQARRLIDDRFAESLAQRCQAVSSSFACPATALVYAGAVRFNSWRQDWGPPVRESIPALLGPVLLGGFAALLWWRRFRTALATAARRAAGLLPARCRARLVAPALGTPHVVAAGLLALGLQPAMLPRPLWVQAIIGGVLVVAGLAAGRALQRLLGGLRRPADGSPWRRRIPAPATAAVLVLGLILVHGAELRVAASTGTAAPAMSATIAGFVLAASAGAVLIALARLLRRAGRGLRRARWAALALTPVMLLGGQAMPAQAADHRPPVVRNPLEHNGFGSLKSPPVNAVTVAPVRVYVARSQARTARERARLAVDRLQDSGGLDRGVVMVAVPTGSGWVNPVAVTELERLHHGDTAVVAVQYAAMPSWLAYLRGGEGVRDSVRALLEELDARLETRSAVTGALRPEVLLYGESLGAWGGLTAYPSGDDLGRVADAALWVGVPAGAPVPAPARTITPAGITVYTHDDDPVPAWDPQLLWRPTPAWRRTHQRWLPGISFWQITGDVLASRLVPQGSGHHYGTELAAPLRALVGP